MRDAGRTQIAAGSKTVLAVGPSPATHAILTALKAGESVFHTLLLTKTVVHALCHIEEHNHCFMHYFGVQTLPETPFSPPLMTPGDGARPGTPAAPGDFGVCAEAFASGLPVTEGPVTACLAVPVHSSVF